MHTVLILGGPAAKATGPFFTRYALLFLIETADFGHCAFKYGTGTEGTGKGYGTGTEGVTVQT